VIQSSSQPSNRVRQVVIVDAVGVEENARSGHWTFVKADVWLSDGAWAVCAR
jgi:hypothetical protein